MSNSLTQRLFPSGVILEILEDPSRAEPLTARELQLVSKAVPKRVDEFRAGRHCARHALRKLGIEEFDLLKGPNREPIWPAGVVGSISHSDKYAAAAVASSQVYRSIGIDIERAKPLAMGLIKTIGSPDEIRMVDSLAGDRPWDTLLFSAKEAFYKAWFPVTRTVLEFHDVRVDIKPAEERFVVQLMNHEQYRTMEITGRFLVTEDMIWTSAIMSH
ncbi:MAG: 4'-phosphopantetheinyl transferase [Pirellula sp.]|jgi:4'-phosphopantetheinyl transferase EntD